jgi:hypothetical protein
MDLTTGDLTVMSTTLWFPQGVLTPDASLLYVATRPPPLEDPDGGYELDGPNLTRFAIDAGQAVATATAQTPACGPLWLSKDLQRLYDGCGHVFATSTFAKMSAFQGVGAVLSVDIRAADGALTVLAVTSPQGVPGGAATPYVQTYDPDALTLLSSEKLPPIPVDGKPIATHGVYVFHDAAGTSRFALIATGASDQYGNPASVYAIARM